MKDCCENHGKDRARGASEKKNSWGGLLPILAVFFAALLLAFTTVQAVQTVTIHNDLQEHQAMMGAAPAAAASQPVARAPAARPAPTMVGGC